MSWIRTLDALEPDLVVNTGDSIAHPQSVEPFLTALGPLLDRPGVFVYGSNDLYSPVVKNPTRYLWRTNADEHKRHTPDLPWAELGEGMETLDLVRIGADGSPHWSRVWPTPEQNPRHAGLERWMAGYGHQIVGRPASWFDNR